MPIVIVPDPGSLVDGRPVLVPGGVEAETRQALENVRAIVEESGSSMERVVKCPVMMADMAGWPRMNAVYATFFPGPSRHQRLRHDRTGARRTGGDRMRRGCAVK
jgi:enamine deaminase RidA (YjgF/YER057c/UK114 family)